MWYEANASTDVGLNRTENQDCQLVREYRGFHGGPTLCVAVADGMGGMANGGLAASTAIEAVEHGLESFSGQARIVPSEALCAALMDIAHQSVSDALPDGGDGGTTLTLCLLQRGRCYLGHVGDCRAYLCRNGSLTQLTVDDRIEGAPSNVVSQALGYTDKLSVATRALRIRSGDALLVCSDGLYKEIDDESIGEHLRNGHAPEDVVHNLVQEALEAGARDNVTACVVRVRGRAFPRWLPLLNARSAALLASLVIVLGLMSWIGMSLSGESRQESEKRNTPSTRRAQTSASQGVRQQVGEPIQSTGQSSIGKRIALNATEQLQVWTRPSANGRPVVRASRPIPIQVLGPVSSGPIATVASVEKYNHAAAEGSRTVVIERRGDKVILTPMPTDLEVFVSGVSFLEGMPIVCHDVSKPWRISWFSDPEKRYRVRLYLEPLSGKGDGP